MSDWTDERHAEARARCLRAERALTGVTSGLAKWYARTDLAAASRRDLPDALDEIERLQRAGPENAAAMRLVRRLARRDCRTPLSGAACRHRGIAPAYWCDPCRCADFVENV